jgi:hypothetical protein
MDPTTIQKAMYLLQKVQIEGQEIPMWNEVMSEFQMYCQPQVVRPPPGTVTLTDGDGVPLDSPWTPPPPDLPEPI